MKIEGFDWDEGNVAKITEHGLSVEEIEEFFHGEIFVGPDLKHSSTEERFLAIGSGPEKRPVISAFTFRKIEGRTLIRPINARFMHDKEAKKYDKAFT